MVERPLERKRESESEGRRLQTFRPERKRRGGRRDRGVSIFAISVCFPSLRFLSFSLFLRLRLRWAHCCNFPIVSRSRCFTAQLCWQSSYYSRKSARLWSVSVPLSVRLRGDIVWLWHLCNLPVVSQSCFCCSHDILHMFVMLCVVSMVPWRFASLYLLSRVVLTLIFLWYSHRSATVSCLSRSACGDLMPPLWLCLCSLSCSFMISLLLLRGVSEQTRGSVTSL